MKWDGFGLMYSARLVTAPDLPNPSPSEELSGGVAAFVALSVASAQARGPLRRTRYRHQLAVAPADYRRFDLSAATGDVPGYLGSYLGRVAVAHLPLLGIEDDAVGLRQPNPDKLDIVSLQHVDDASVARRKSGGTNHRHQWPYPSPPDWRG